MSRKSKPGRAIQWLIKLVVFIIVLVLVFLASYFAVGRWYESHLDKRQAEQEKAEEATAQIQAEESVKNCDFTMIYLDDQDTEEVEYSALRIFNRLTQEMSVFMIPGDSKMTVSGSLSETLSDKADTEVSGELLFSQIGAYYSDQETKYEMMTKAAEDLIGGVEISSYEALDYESVIQIVNLADPVTVKLGQLVTYTDEEGQTLQLTPNEEHEIDGYRAIGILTYTDGFGSGDGGRIERSSDYLMEYVTSLTTQYDEKTMSEYLTSYYQLVTTNGKMDDASSYIEDCLKLTEENLAFYTMKGTQKEEEFILDPEKIREDIMVIMGEDAYKLATTEESEETSTAKEEGTTTLSETGVDISSKDKIITIYNGAYVNGLAGKWRDRLEEEGYKIEGIYNYSGGTRDNGRIIVREEGYGEDLKEAYFPDAEIEVGTPEDGADIQIILGRSEDF